MPEPTDVLPLMDQGNELLQVGADGRGFYTSAAPSNPLSASLSGGPGLGGSHVPATGQIPKGASAPAYKPPTPDELMALADKMQSQYDFEPGPSQVEPTLERDTNVPYWLRNYAEKEGIEKVPDVPESKSKNQIVASNTYLSPEEKRKYMR